MKTVLGSMSAASAAASAPVSSPPASADMARAGVHVAEGKVESVQADGITISHGPVATLKWPAMTMGFGRPDAKAFVDVKPGDTVRFEFRQGGPMGYELVSVQRIGGKK